MTKTRPLRGIALAGVIAAGLASCGSGIGPSFDPSGLQSRSSIMVGARVETAGQAMTQATPRSENAKRVAAQGAGEAAGAFLADPSLLALAVVAPVVVPISMAGSAAAGATIGAMTGSPHSQEEIDTAVGILRRSFDVSPYSAEFEREVGKALSRQLARRQQGPCVRTRTSSRSCPSGRAPARLSLDLSVRLVPWGVGSRGGMALLGNVDVRAAPEGILTPGCIRWQFRKNAGDLMVIAGKDGAVARTLFRQMIPELAGDLARLIVPGAAVTEEVAEPLPEPAWVVTEKEFREMIKTHQGRRLIRGKGIIAGTEEEAAASKAARAASPAKGYTLGGGRARKVPHAVESGGESKILWLRGQC